MEAKDVLKNYQNYQKEIEIPENIKELIEKRNQARKEKKWEESDKIRDEIQKLGYNIKDTKEGIKIEKL